MNEWSAIRQIRQNPPNRPRLVMRRLNHDSNSDAVHWPRDWFDNYNTLHESHRNANFSVSNMITVTNGLGRSLNTDMTGLGNPFSSHLFRHVRARVNARYDDDDDDYYNNNDDNDNPFSRIIDSLLYAPSHPLPSQQRVRDAKQKIKRYSFPNRPVHLPPPTSCVICFEEFENQDAMAQIECGHEFHATCIDRWLQEKIACPVCRFEIK